MAEMVRVNVRISEDMNGWFNDRSKETGIPKSTLMYLALENYVQNQKVLADSNGGDALKALLEQFFQHKDVTQRNVQE